MFLTLLGCGRGGPERYELSGAISYDGQPVENGDIIFSPLDSATGKASGGPIVAGRYSIASHEGPTAGKYRVEIIAMRPSGKKNAGEGTTPPADLMEQYIPSAYNDDSKFEVEIGDDKHNLDFSLERIPPVSGKL